MAVQAACPASSKKEVNENIGFEKACARRKKAYAKSYLSTRKRSQRGFVLTRRKRQNLRPQPSHQFAAMFT